MADHNDDKTVIADKTVIVDIPASPSKPAQGAAGQSANMLPVGTRLGEFELIGLVGAGGIGAPLIFAMNQYAWNDVSAIFLGFVLLVWLIDVGSARLRTRRTAAAAPGK